MEAIVVGLDGSAASLDALSWAGAIATRTNAKLVAVYAGLPGKSIVATGLYAGLADKASRKISDWAAQRTLGVTPIPVVVDEDPRTGLVAAATERSADLLVIGARGTSSHAGVSLGGVAQYLSQHPTLPLAIVPAGAPSRIRHVVVGVDGSTGSLAAVRFCAGLARALQVGVTALLAQESFAEWVPADDLRGWQHHAEKQVLDWVRPITDADMPVEVVVDHDVHPVAALIRALEAHPDAIAIVGTRGRGGFAGLRLGRVPLQLLHHTQVPVIIVPAEPT
jgi:nucleotide-binding universal stress UspA family protein